MYVSALLNQALNCIKVMIPAGNLKGNGKGDDPSSLAKSFYTHTEDKEFVLPKEGRNR